MSELLSVLVVGCGHRGTSHADHLNDAVNSLHTVLAADTSVRSDKVVEW